MSKEIICVYQDCVLCGDRGKKIKNYAFEKNLSIRRVSFTSDEGRELSAIAVTEHKIGKMPFFTDGVKFSTSLKDLVEKCEKKATKKVEKSEKKATRKSSTRKRIKKVMEGENGSVE